MRAGFLLCRDVRSRLWARFAGPRDNVGMPAPPLVFRPLVETRTACALVGLVPAAGVGIGAVRLADAALLTLAAPVVALGVLLAVRGFRMAVIVEARTVTVQGMFRSRTLPRDGVDALRDGDTSLLFVLTPTLYWHQADNTEQRTRMWMFGDPVYQLADVTGHNRRTLSRLRKLLGISHTGDRRLRER